MKSRLARIALALVLFLLGPMLVLPFAGATYTPRLEIPDVVTNITRRAASEH